MASVVTFSISSWSAWAPGLSTSDDWRAWATTADGLGGDDSPKIPEFSPMLTRRASRADRIALRAALDCAPPASEPLPTVFASRHGEVHRSVELLEALARGQGLSPTAFSLSVHNAAAGLLSIGRQDRAPSTSLAAGLDSLPMAVLEAVGLLDEGAPRVLVVVYEEPLPTPFQPYVAEQEPCAAVALLLERQAPHPFALELVPGGANENLERGHLLPFLKFLAGEQPQELSVRHGTRGWRWRRTAA
jgi:hypothetical protein